MIVICLEGVHGCGKTELIKALSNAGYLCLDEGFINMPNYNLPPQSFTMESIWASRWIERLLKLKKENEVLHPGRQLVYFADRSPYSAVYYAPSGHLLEPLIKQQIKELEDYAGIRLFTVHISVEEGLLWKRILDRLQREPERKKYNEDSKEWLDRTISWYSSKQELWNFTIHNNGDIHEVTDTLLKHLVANIANLAEHLA